MDRPKSIWDELADTWPVRMAKSAYHGAMLPGQAASGMLSVKPTVPGMWSEEDEARQQFTNQEAFNRVQDLGGLAMTGGLPVGGVPGVSLASGYSFRPQKAVAGFHGSAVPEDFSKFRTSDKDLGVHFATNPNIAAEYSLGDFGALQDKKPHSVLYDPTQDFKPRTYPVVADLNKVFKLPVDTMGDWHTGSEALYYLKDYVSDTGHKFPKGMLDKLQKASDAPGSWEKNLIPMLQEHGYDALKYPHMEMPNFPTDYKMNSYMVFDPSKVAPMYSKEGQDIIARRGGFIRPYTKKLQFNEGDREYFNSMMTGDWESYDNFLLQPNK